MSPQVSIIPCHNNNVFSEIKILKNTHILKNIFPASYSQNCNAFCRKFFGSFAFQMVSPSYNKLAKFVGGNSEFTTVKLDGVNCLIQIFLTFKDSKFQNFQSPKQENDFKQSKKNITKRASMGSQNIDRNKRLLNIKSTFPFFTRCF